MLTGKTFSKKKKLSTCPLLRKLGRYLKKKNYPLKIGQTWQINWARRGKVRGVGESNKKVRVYLSHSKPQRFLCILERSFCGPG